MAFASFSVVLTGVSTSKQFHGIPKAVFIKTLVAVTPLISKSNQIVNVNATSLGSIGNRLLLANSNEHDSEQGVKMNTAVENYKDKKSGEFFQGISCTFLTIDIYTYVTLGFGWLSPLRATISGR